MHHLYKVSRSSGTNIGHTFSACTILCCHLHQKRLKCFVSRFITSRHHAWAIQCSLFPTRNSHAEESNALLLKSFCSALRIEIVAVPGIDEDILFLEQGSKGIDHFIHRPPCIHHKENLSWRFEVLHELLECFTGNEFSFSAVFFHKFVHFLRCSIKEDNFRTIPCSVACEICSHRPKPNDTELHGERVSLPWKQSSGIEGYFFVFSQSLKNFSSPILESGCSRSFLKTSYGIVQMCAPSIAASSICRGLRVLATSTSVSNP